MGFYNTTKESGQQLLDFQEKTENQEKLIFAFFEKHRDHAFTPFEIMEAMNLIGVPITSIRRAMSDLTKSGKIVKTNKMKPGRKGRRNYTWKFNGK